MNPCLFAATACAAFALMEGVAWATHRYVMHGALWCLHRSHHRPREGWFEANDWFAVFFATPAIAMFWLGTDGFPYLLPLAIGVTAYGAAYAFVHDGLVHRRFAPPFRPRSLYWRRLIAAHHLHHAVVQRTGCVSFGFLVVQPEATLRRQLRRGRTKPMPSP